MATVNLAFFIPLTFAVCMVILAPSLSLPAQETVEKEKRGDASHWCCERDLTPVTVQVTRKEVQRHIRHENYTYIVGYENCPENPDSMFPNSTGFFKNCPVYKTRIVDTPYYTLATVTLNKTETPMCPEEELHCCPGFTLFKNDCVNPEKLKTIQALIDAGLVG